MVSAGSPLWSPGDGLYATCEPNESFPSRWVWFFVFCFLFCFGFWLVWSQQQKANYKLGRSVSHFSWIEIDIICDDRALVQDVNICVLSGSFYPMLWLFWLEIPILSLLSASTLPPVIKKKGEQLDWEGSWGQPTTDGQHHGGRICTGSLFLALMTQMIPCNHFLGSFGIDEVHG